MARNTVAEKITIAQLAKRLRSIHPANINEGAYVMGCFVATERTNPRLEKVAPLRFIADKAEELGHELCVCHPGMSNWDEIMQGYGLLIAIVYDFVFAGDEERLFDGVEAINELHRISAGLGYKEIVDVSQVGLLQMVKPGFIAGPERDPIDAWLRRITMRELIEYAGPRLRAK